MLIVYGGAFNPLTAAHQAAIRALRAQHPKDTLVLLPSGGRFIAQWKPGQGVLPDLTRLDILRAFLAQAGMEDVKIDLSALQENLCTFDALQRLRAAYGQAEARFVIGEDKLPELPRWAHAEALLESCRFIVLTYDPAAPALPDGVQGDYLLLPRGTEETHASALRLRMARHDPGLKADPLLGPALGAFPDCLRLCALSPQVYLGDPMANAREIIRRCRETDGDVLVFPELSICGYTCQDLFLSPAFVAACQDAARLVMEETRELKQLVFIGCPVSRGERLYNCALALQGGRLLAVIPKTHLANYGEFYERRWFASALEGAGGTICLFGQEAPFGADVLLRQAETGLLIGAELCEDAWAPLPPSMEKCAAGARVMVNLSASNDIVAKPEYRRQMLSSLSARGICSYVYASSGAGESSSDLVYGGHRMIFANGHLLSETRAGLADEGPDAAATVNLALLAADRARMKSFTSGSTASFREVPFSMATYRFPAPVGKAPFVPPVEGSARKQRCLDILQLQAQGLCQRLRGIGCKKAVIGISGGLDSTLALLVTKTAFEALGLPMAQIVTITMPCFATSGRTLKNATDLCLQLGTDFRKVDISAACTAHGHDIGHAMQEADIAFENIQARERTQVLMDVANMENAIVVGTGDLSELALGWCTYNGDHISHYGVNCGVPKTLVKFIVETYARELAAPDTRETLLSILGTEITPELVPGGASTEERIGKYDLHDFFLYYFMRYGLPRSALRFLAAGAFGAWQLPEIEKTLDTFLRRFFQNQFKRNCLPDGPKIGSVCLSPRGDWRLPADMGQCPPLQNR